MRYPTGIRPPRGHQEGLYRTLGYLAQLSSANALCGLGEIGCQLARCMHIATGLRDPVRVRRPVAVNWRQYATLGARHRVD